MISDDEVVRSLERHRVFSPFAELRKTAIELQRLADSILFQLDGTLNLPTPDKGPRIVKTRPEPRSIAIEVARLFDLPTEALLVKTHRRRFFDARITAYWFSWRMSECSQEEVGQAFGGLHHSTVVSGTKRLRVLVESDVHFRVRHREIEARLCSLFGLRPVLPPEDQRNPLVANATFTFL